MAVSRPWAVAMVFAAVLSSLHVNVSEKHDLSGSIGVTSITVALLVLIWLPSLLRVLGIAGGGVKTPAGEATTPGLAALFDTFDPQTKREALPSVLTALTSPDVLTDADERGKSRELRRELELQLAAVTPQSQDIRETLDRYAGDYEEMRRTMPPGGDRTRLMTRLVAEVRAVARGMPPMATELRRMLSEGSDGERIVGLAVAQDQPNRNLFDEICGAIVESHSAFEQYHALVAVLEMLTVIDDRQRRVLVEVLRDAQDDPLRAIGDDMSRARLVDTLLTYLAGQR